MQLFAVCFDGSISIVNVTIGTWTRGSRFCSKFWMLYKASCSYHNNKYIIHSIWSTLGNRTKDYDQYLFIDKYQVINELCQFVLQTILTLKGRQSGYDYKTWTYKIY